MKASSVVSTLLGGIPLSCEARVATGLFTLRRIVIALALCLIAIAISLYFAIGYEPSFYRQRAAISPVIQRQASDELLASATAVASAARHEGAWSLSLTDDQINGWLAVDLPENHRQLLPTVLSDPRVRLKPHEAMVACRYQAGGVSTVVSLDCDLYLAEPNVLAMRFRRLRSGAIPMPLETILDALAKFAEESNIRLRWSRQGGDPVALVELPPLANARGVDYRLESVELREGAIFLAGRSKQVETVEGASDIR